MTRKEKTLDQCLPALVYVSLGQGVGQDDFCGFGNSSHDLEDKHCVSNLIFGTFPSVLSCMVISLGNVLIVLCWSRGHVLTVALGQALEKGSWRTKEGSWIPGCQDWKGVLGRAGAIKYISLQEKMDPVPLAEGHLFFTGLRQGLGRETRNSGPDTPQL